MALDITGNTSNFFLVDTYKTKPNQKAQTQLSVTQKYKIEITYNMVLSIISFDATWNFTSSQLHKEQ